MRIDQLNQSRLDLIKNNSNQQPNKVDHFPAMFKQTTNSLVKDNLKQLLTKINEQGQMLAEKRTIHELVSYKRLVKQFMEEASNGLQLLEKHSQQQHKTHKIIHAVDENLLTLQKDVIDREKDGVQLLAAVGEIKGLLVNLYL
jgi:uncharacterized protein